MVQDRNTKTRNLLTQLLLQARGGYLLHATIRESEIASLIVLSCRASARRTRSPNGYTTSASEADTVAAASNTTSILINSSIAPHTPVTIGTEY